MKHKIKNFYQKIIIERYPKIFRPSSKPYISGDTFRKYADHIFDESTSFKPKDVRKNDIVFINSDLIEVYFVPFLEIKTSQCQMQRCCAGI